MSHGKRKIGCSNPSRDIHCNYYVKSSSDSSTSDKRYAIAVSVKIPQRWPCKRMSPIGMSVKIPLR